MAERSTGTAQEAHRSPADLREDVEELLKVDALAAFDRLSSAERQGMVLDPWLRKRKALALSRVGAAGEGLRLVEDLVDSGEDDEETLGLLGRVHKTLALSAHGASERRRHLGEAARAYERAYDDTGGYWTGVNAATLACLAGHPGRARRLARSVLERCASLGGRPANPPSDTEYWRQATVAEASLLLGRLEAAVVAYARAREVVDGWSQLASTRRNARLLARRLRLGWTPIDRALAVPPLAICVGHMTDAPGRRRPRFPEEGASRVKAAIARWVAHHGVRFGVAGLARGTDILFHEAVREAGGVTRPMLPYPAGPFRGDSVDAAAPGGAASPNESWGRRFDAIHEGDRAHGRRIGMVSPHRFARDSAWYEHGNAFMEGMARSWARELDAPILRLAVWDGRGGDGPGGTASMVGRWRRAGLGVDRIDPAEPEEGASAVRGRVPATAVPRGRGADLLSVLFADARGFSQLTEEELPRFHRHFTGAIAGVVRRSSGRPLLRETWGDGLFLAFRGTDAAGRLALEIRDRIAAADWGRVGLPPTLAIRIALHTGPAKLVLDPVTGRCTALGTHISHAARIEPVTPPGRVYASESFAVLAEAEGVRDFACAYVGQVEWAKHYGALPTYHVDWA